MVKNEKFYARKETSLQAQNGGFTGGRPRSLKDIRREYRLECRDAVDLGLLEMVG